MGVYLQEKQKHPAEIPFPRQHPPQVTTCRETKGKWHLTLSPRWQSLPILNRKWVMMSDPEPPVLSSKQKESSVLNITLVVSATAVISVLAIWPQFPSFFYRNTLSILLTYPLLWGCWLGCGMSEGDCQVWHSRQLDKRTVMKATDNFSFF